MDSARKTPAFRSAVITGATGFLGFRLCQRLMQYGVFTRTMTRASSSPERVKALEAIGVFNHTFESDESIADILFTSQPDVVFHLAADFVSSHSVDDVPRLLASNVELTAKICKSVIDSGCRALVTAGSAMQSSARFSIEDVYATSNLFDLTKQAADEVIDRYVTNSMSTDALLSAITLKIYDSYGPNDPRRKFLKLLSEASRNSATLKAGPSNQHIHIVHVDDLVDGFVHAANMIVTGAQSGRALYTLPSAKAVTMRELAELWLELKKRRVKIDWVPLDAADEKHSTPWEGEQLPGWEPNIPLEVGLLQTDS